MSFKPIECPVCHALLRSKYEVRDTVACDPTERGIDTIYEWCRERLEGADGAEDELYCSIMSAIEDYRHPERLYARTVRAVDRDALLTQTGRLCEND